MMRPSLRMPWQSLAAWVAAAAVAAVPTWEQWRLLAEADGGSVYHVSMCRGWPETVALVEALRADLERLHVTAVTWGVPAVAVLAGLLLSVAGKGTAGRRLAGGLALTALVGPLTPVYFDPDGCGRAAMFSGAWVAQVLQCLGIREVCLLVAALLVLAVSGPAHPAGHPAGEGESAAAWRRTAALTVDYLAAVTVLTLATQALGLDGAGLDLGERLLPEPGDTSSEAVVRATLSAPLLFLYAWGGHLLRGRTPGKLLMGLRVAFLEGGGRARRGALRALLFPVLVVMPGFSMLWLFLDGLCALVDPDGRAAHDRFTGGRVVRARRRDAVRGGQAAVS
ncbi:RDD family protein [Nonomuraea pusilla]|uniref:RDD family protein n=1 Tax=Nonomuraea pusilla TaxID=46177 RepID=UPI00331C6226